MRCALMALALVFIAACAQQASSPSQLPAVSEGQRLFCANRANLPEHLYRECLVGTRHGQN
jgi:uncharacterized lipoprotein YmbA